MRPCDPVLLPLTANLTRSYVKEGLRIDMCSGTNQIKCLPNDSTLKIRSSQILTSLAQIISELVQNSLDASATELEVGVDLEEWTCWVRDNGHGISKGDMALLAESLRGERYGSSKAYTVNSLDTISTFGFRGEALASAADLCCLEISSRSAMSKETTSIIIKGGKVLHQGRAIRWHRETPGTVVCVRDAFYNLPVRRRSHPTVSKTLDMIKAEIYAFSLAFPDVSFLLEKNKNVGTSATLKEVLLRLSNTGNTIATFKQLFGADLVEHIGELSVDSEELRLEGFISLVGSTSKAYQFLYVNNRLIPYGDFHRIVNSQFNASAFSKPASTENENMEIQHAKRKAVYVLKLTVPSHAVDSCLEPSKTSFHFKDKASVEALISSAIYDFLVAHGFASPKSKPDEPIPPAKEHIPDSFLTIADRWKPPSPFYIREWDTVQLDEELVWIDERTREVFLVDPVTGNSRSHVKPQPWVSSQESESNSLQSKERRTITRSSGQKELAKEVDPTPKWIVDALQANDVFAQTEPKIRSLPLPANRTDLNKPENGPQIPQWRNPKCPNFRQQCQTTDLRPIRSQNGSDGRAGSHSQFVKYDLRKARVINQVDNKFIACLLSEPDDDELPKDTPLSTEYNSLVLIDQHAAHERVRVEQFLKELCDEFLRSVRTGSRATECATTKELSPSVPVLLSSHEAVRLATSVELQRHLAFWGFCLAELPSAATGSANLLDLGLDPLEDKDNKKGNVQILVTHLPSVISAKLLKGDLLRYVIQGFLSMKEAVIPDSSTIGSTLAEVDKYDRLWLKALKWCPPELLDVVNSQACRGAIMFNDPLSIDECQELVKELAETVFPFQCAHGRPSLVSIINRDTGFKSKKPLAGSNVSWSKFYGNMIAGSSHPC